MMKAVSLLRMTLPTRKNLDLLNIHELVCILSILNRGFALCSTIQTLIDYFNSIFHNLYFNVSLSVSEIEKINITLLSQFGFKKPHHF